MISFRTYSYFCSYKLKFRFCSCKTWSGMVLKSKIFFSYFACFHALSFVFADSFVLGGYQRLQMHPNWQFCFHHEWKTDHNRKLSVTNFRCKISLPVIEISFECELSLNADLQWWVEPEWWPAMVSRRPSEVLPKGQSSRQHHSEFLANRCSPRGDSDMPSCRISENIAASSGSYSMLPPRPLYFINPNSKWYSPR